MFASNNVMTWSAKDQQGKAHYMFGNIDGNGAVEIKLVNPDGEIKINARIVGHNRIVGSWSLKEKTMASGQFEIQMAGQKRVQIHRIVGGQPTTDTYYIGIDTYKNKYVSGVGVDAVGMYLVSGKVRQSGKIKLGIEYKTKFSMSFKGKRKQNPSHVEGSWSIPSGGSGPFSMTIDDVQQLNIHPLQAGNAPFGQNTFSQAGLSQSLPLQSHPLAPQSTQYQPLLHHHPHAPQHQYAQQSVSYSHQIYHGQPQAPDFTQITLNHGTEYAKQHTPFDDVKQAT